MCSVHSAIDDGYLDAFSGEAVFAELDSSRELDAEGEIVGVGNVNVGSFGFDDSGDFDFGGCNDSHDCCIDVVAKENDLPIARFSNTNPQVDYSGIGVDVNSFKPDGGFQLMSGTSMACPHVCGLLTALLDKESDPVKGDAAMRALLKEKYTIDIGVTGADNATGLGFVTYLTKAEFDEVLGGPPTTPDAPDAPDRPSCSIQ